MEEDEEGKRKRTNEDEREGETSERLFHSSNEPEPVRIPPSLPKTIGNDTGSRRSSIGFIGPAFIGRIHILKSRTSQGSLVPSLTSRSWILASTIACLF